MRYLLLLAVSCFGWTLALGVLAMHTLLSQAKDGDFKSGVSIMPLPVIIAFGATAGTYFIETNAFPAAYGFSLISHVILGAASIPFLVYYERARRVPTPRDSLAHHSGQ